MRTLGESKVLTFCFWFEGGEKFQNFLVLPQDFGSFPQSFGERGGAILMLVECLKMIKPIVISFCSMGG